MGAYAGVARNAAKRGAKSNLEFSEGFRRFPGHHADLGSMAVVMVRPRPLSIMKPVSYESLGGSRLTT